MLENQTAFVVLSFIVILSGCASQPDELATQSVSPLQFKGYTCDQLVSEDIRVSNRINELYLNLKKKADNDAVQTGIGIILFWPALFLLEGGDGVAAQEYSRLKGEKQGIEQTANMKDCDFTPANLLTEQDKKESETN